MMIFLPWIDVCNSPVSNLEICGEKRHLEEEKKTCSFSFFSFSILFDSFEEIFVTSCEATMVKERHPFFFSVQHTSIKRECFLHQRAHTFSQSFHRVKKSNEWVKCKCIFTRTDRRESNRRKKISLKWSKDLKDFYWSHLQWHWNVIVLIWVNVLIS